MRKPALSVLVWALIAGWATLLGGPEESLVQQGNLHYEAGAFEDALRSYLAVSDAGFESASLYFNIGNCYHKLGDPGRSILYFERALKLNPGDEDTRFNLSIVQLGTVDKIDAQPDFLLLRLARGTVRWLPQKTLTMLLSLFYLLGISSLVGWILLRPRTTALWFGRMSLLTGLLTILVVSALLGRWWDDHSRTEAVIVQTSVEVMSAPGRQATPVFSLHAGTKVLVDQISGEWVEIVLPDRKAGWVPKAALEII